MKTSEFKKLMENGKLLNFQFTDGTFVPPHFHITEFGITSKNFIDCGGKIHSDKKATLQIWVSIDVEHRLNPKLVLSILNKVQPFMSSEDLDIEIEYQEKTLSIYQLEFVEDKFMLMPKDTACLALSTCGIPELKTESSFTMIASGNVCEPGGNCC